MAGKCRRQGTTGAADDKSVLALLGFRETSQLCQDRECPVHPVPQISSRRRLSGGHPMTDVAQGVVNRGWREALGENIQEQPQ